VTIPALTAPRRARKLAVTEATLPNGLTVIAVRKPGVPLAEVRLRLPALSPRPSHPARVSLLTDAMLTGAGDLDRNGIATTVQGLGGDLSVSADADRLLMGGNVLATGLGALFELMASALTGATYARKEVETERERLVERLTIARSRPGVVASETLGKRMWGEHPYALDLPTIDAVAETSPGNLRKLHDDLIRPQGAILIVVGDITAARVVDLAAAAFADWTGTAKAKPVPDLPVPTPGLPLLVVDRPGSVQTSVRYGRPAVTRTDPKFPALQLANLVFGGYFSSRWTENIREDKGYTYGPHSRVDHHQLGSMLMLDVEVATEVTAPALLETYYELGRIASLGVTEEELASVRQYAIGTLALSTSTQAGLASNLSALAPFGLGLDYILEQPKRLATVTIEDVNAAAAEFFGPSGLTGVVVGDAATIAGPLGALGAVELA
jgi:predicted Zn-dependent peptidase